MKRIIGLGWDVGGWLGKNHGIAVVEWQNDELKWLSFPVATRLPKCGIFTPADFHKEIDNVDSDTTVVLGIDAPLGYPVAYQRLVSGGCPTMEKPDAEIDNIFAYRETERHIYRTFKKKPLSATFDKLGNNTSLAITTVRRWCVEHHFLLQPSSSSKMSNRDIIEVYPALIKTVPFSDVYSNMIRMIPAEVGVDSDAFDAAICALVALSYGLAGKSSLLPEVVRPPEGWDKENNEGWIYYPKL